jgi:hypothetical protein
VSELPEDRPWTEAEWERFIYERDIRTARYGDLLETLRNDPNRDAIIAREMGWDYLLDDEDNQDIEGPEGDSPDDFDEFVDSESAGEADDFDEASLAWPEELDEDGLDPEVGDSLRERRTARDRLPAYAHAFRWGLNVHKALQVYVEKEAGDDPPEPDEPLQAAFANSLIVAAKIAGGHGMNFDGREETLCGNIVYCKIALEAASKTLGALEELKRLGRVPGNVLTPLTEEGVVVRQLVEQRIADLRSRVWWA